MRVLVVLDSKGWSAASCRPLASPARLVPADPCGLRPGGWGELGALGRSARPGSGQAGTAGAESGGRTRAEGQELGVAWAASTRARKEHGVSRDSSDGLSSRGVRLRSSSHPECWGRRFVCWGSLSAAALKRCFCLQKCSSDLERTLLVPFQTGA